MRILILLILCAALCASCSGGTTAGLTDDAQHFTLTVLPESYALGGAAETSVTTRPDAGGLLVDITAQADGLKAFYFDLAYDASQWHPVTVEQNLGGDSETIEIASTELTGRVHAGRVLTRPDSRAGISGRVRLATVRFAPGAAQPGRSASAPPDRDGSKPVLEIDAAGILTWKYASIGDYDQNREVNAADLTPIAVNLGEASGGGKFPYTSIESIVDGDENGEVNIADISPIAGNLLNTVAGYAVYRSQNAADYPATNTEAPKVAAIATVPYEDGVGAPTQERLTFTYDASAEGGTDPLNIFWVRPVDTAGAAGSPSNMVSPVGSGNVAPVIATIVANPNPVPTGGDTDITVTATDADGDPLTYTYSADNGATVDPTGTNTTVLHAPNVVVATIVTLTVMVEDGQGNSDTDTLQISVTPEAVTEVHIAFTPAAEGGSGTSADPYGLLGETDYTFTATDQNGNDITSETTFTFDNAPPGGPAFPHGDFTGNIFTTAAIGFGNYTIIGTYHDGQPDEVVSNFDLVGEEMYFTNIFVMDP